MANYPPYSYMPQQQAFSPGYMPPQMPVQAPEVLLNFCYISYISILS